MHIREAVPGIVADISIPDTQAVWQAYQVLGPSPFHVLLPAVPGLSSLAQRQVPYRLEHQISPLSLHCSGASPSIPGS